jgi:hypothetical protein
MTVLREYEDFYNTHRPHRALSQAAPLRPLPDGITDLDHFRVRRRDRRRGPRISPGGIGFRHPQVSGPAAPRLISAAREAATRYEGMFLSPRQARALLADPALQVHDNPRAFLACNYDPAKALCHPGRAAGKAAAHPDLDRCNPACANIARTGEHIDALTAETARLRAEAASPLAPEPIRQRLLQRADALEQIAERHARTCITAKADGHG